MLIPSAFDPLDLVCVCVVFAHVCVYMHMCVYERGG